MKNAKAVRLLLTANFISGIAQGLSMISIPLYFQKAGLEAQFGLFYMVITGISILWSLYAGTIIDKHNRQRIFLGINTVCGSIVAIAALWGYGDAGAAAWTAALVFATTFFNYNIHYPSVYAFMQEVSEQQHYHRIASYIEIQSQLASVFAGAGAAFLLEGMDFGWIQIPRWELWQIFTLNAATYFLSLFFIAAIRFESIAERYAETGSIVERLRLGYSYLRQQPYIFLFGVASFAVFVSIMIHVFYLAPLYVEAQLHTTGDIFAWSEVLFSMGAIFAGAAIQWIFRSVTVVRAAIILTLVALSVYLSLALTASIPLFLIVSFLLGWSNAGIRVLRMSYLFRVIPNQYAGRAGSIFHVSNTLFRMLFLGIFALPVFHKSGVYYALLVLVAFLAMSAAVMAVYYRRIVAAGK